MMCNFSESWRSVGPKLNHSTMNVPVDDSTVHGVSIKFARRVDVGSACAGIGPTSVPENGRFVVYTIY